MKEHYKNNRHQFVILSILLLSLASMVFGGCKDIKTPTDRSDIVAPTTPGTPSASHIASFSLNLDWTASTDIVGVTGYQIYRCEGTNCTPGTKIGTSATNSFSDTDLTASTAYCYSVSAYDAAGNNSATSGTVTATTSVATVATKLWYTDFSHAQFTLHTPVIAPDNAGALQYFDGINAATGLLGPMTILGVNRSAFQLIVGKQITTTLSNYLANEVQQMTGPAGNQIYALHQIVKDNSPYRDQTGVGQNSWNPVRNGPDADFYFSYWMMFQSDLATQITGPHESWRTVTELKTGGNSNHRIGVWIQKDADGKLYWEIQGDGAPNSSYQRFWYKKVPSTTVPIPVGKWFKFEVFCHRGTNGGTDGRYWVAVNGQVLADYKAGGTGFTVTFPGTLGSMYPVNPVLPISDPIDRLFFTNVYSGGKDNAEQWVTDLEIWDGWPCGEGVSCYVEP